jgi:hypothetical protein
MVNFVITPVKAMMFNKKAKPFAFKIPYICSPFGEWSMVNGE